MSGRGKLRRFEANAESANVVEEGKENFGRLAGRWASDFFGDSGRPLTLEIGCGRGDYTVGIAALHPERNFVGVDVKGSRLFHGSQEAAGRGLRNVAFLRARAEQIAEHFAPGEVSEIWLTFPDPRPKNSDRRKRLTSPRFLSLYQRLLAPGGLVRLKTDSRFLFEDTLAVLREFGVTPDAATDDFTASAWSDVAGGLQTTYERRFAAEGLPIHYVAFRLPPP